MWPYPKIKIINSCFRSNVINASKKIFSQSSCLKPLICNCLAISEDEVVVQPLWLVFTCHGLAVFVRCKTNAKIIYPAMLSLCGGMETQPCRHEHFFDLFFHPLPWAFDFHISDQRIPEREVNHWSDLFPLWYFAEEFFRTLCVFLPKCPTSLWDPSHDLYICSSTILKWCLLWSISVFFRYSTT